MSRTEESLKAAFSGESQANRKYTAFARKADEEGYPEIANLFRATAEGETAHALQHLHHLQGVNSTRENLEAALQGETEEYTRMYPEMARVARQEGQEEIARWFEATAKAEKAHADRFREALQKLGASGA
ncbi:MAG: rubrerythrin [Chloroflexi bacterium]|nr:rubrerythrin [Chloroflexota bacterium]